MSNISRRLDSIEKKLRTGKHSEPELPSVIYIGRPLTPEDEKRAVVIGTCTTDKEQ